MIDVDLLKSILNNKYQIDILEDMEGPCALNRGMYLVARSRKVNNWSIAKIAEYIAAENKKYFAFYSYDDEFDIIRYAIVNEDTV